MAKLVNATNNCSDPKYLPQYVKEVIGKPHHKQNIVAINPKPSAEVLIATSVSGDNVLISLFAECVVFISNFAKLVV